MTAKHTPGEWKVSEKRSYSGLPIVVAFDDDGCDIAIATVWNPGSNEFKRTKESESNARLIAAAPELLEALEDMTDRYCKCDCIFIFPNHSGKKIQHTDEDCKNIGCMNFKYKQIIAKAKGE